MPAFGGENQVENAAVDFDETRIDKAALALLYLTLHDHSRAWKSIDWSVMNRLFDLGLIDNPVNKAKSVVLTAEGIAQAENAAKRLFGSPTSGRFETGRSSATVTAAAGTKGILCKSAIGGGYFFRVENADGGFTDYELQHDELEITISPNALASFYETGEDRVLDHSPEVLGFDPSKQ